MNLKSILIIFLISSCSAITFAQTSAVNKAESSKSTVFGNTNLRLGFTAEEIHRDEYNLGKSASILAGIETKLFTERIRITPELMYFFKKNTSILSLNINIDVLRTRSKELALTLSMGGTDAFYGENNSTLGGQLGTGFTLCPRNSRFSFEILPLYIRFDEEYTVYSPKMTLKYKL